MRYARGNIKLLISFSCIFVILCLLLRDALDAPEPVDEGGFRNVLEPTRESVGKRVTKSLSERGRVAELSGHILMLNRVPRSGSEVLVSLLQWLQGRNNFKHVRLAGDAPRLSRPRQKVFTQKVSDAIQDNAIPLSFDRSIYFTNFSAFGWQSPTYINIIRDPIEKIEPRLFSTEDNVEDILECWTDRYNHECLIHGNPYDLTIPYFCGHEVSCMELNNKWALKKAKENVDQYFPAVGVLEYINETIFMLENELPFFFRGAIDIYTKKISGKHQTKKEKSEISESLKNYLRYKLSLEFEFYDWIKARLFQQANYYKEKNKYTTGSKQKYY